MRYFNTAGPCVPELHYMLPPEPRLPDARGLINEGQFFVVHAPRQTGKTTTLRALARTLTAEGQRLAWIRGPDSVHRGWIACRDTTKVPSWLG